MIGVASHPRLLVTPPDHPAIAAKIESARWAKAQYQRMKSEIDGFVERAAAEPQWLSSRLAMNWETHFSTPVVRNGRLVGGEGRAAGPTPRFAGARNWVTHFSLPKKLEDLRPFNDRSGRICLMNSRSGEYEWTEPAQTGRAVEIINQRIMTVAARAAFLWWVTGEEPYARFAADILWTYMDGFSLVTAPRVEDSDDDTDRVIGMTSFEVIHEDIVTPLSVAYDFVHGALERAGRDPRVVQDGLRRIIDRVIDGGDGAGNWNLNQARIIAYGGLVLEDDASYADGRGRQHYADIVLRARLPRQTGILHVIAGEIDEGTALWPEVPAYGFRAIQDLLHIATLVGDASGRTVLDSALLKLAVVAQNELVYPNGLSLGLGDSDQAQFDTVAAELAIAAARASGDAATEERLAAILSAKIADRSYVRGTHGDLVLALAKFVDEHRASTGARTAQPRTFYAKPLNVIIQRNLADQREHALAAAMFGTDGGHVHSNGLAIELYGAGLVLAPDLGRGGSYWQDDHVEYYSQPPAHNTVIVDGRSNYPTYGDGHVPMTLERVEPPRGHPGVSPNLSFARSSFAYASPAAVQARTLTLFRTSSTSGFYVDVFASRKLGRDESDARKDDSYHDYLYHGLGQALELFDPSGERLSGAASSVLSSAHGNLKGYDYFKNETSVPWAGDLRGVFSLDCGAGAPRRAMSLWMLGQEGRTVFSVEGPPCWAARSRLPRAVAELSMPTLVVRQAGDAWRYPFVAVLEPHFQPDGATIRSIRAGAITGRTGAPFAPPTLGVEVSGRLPRESSASRQREFAAAVVMGDGLGDIEVIGPVAFECELASIFSIDGVLEELYLGYGRKLAVGEASIEAIGGCSVSASFRRWHDGWRYSCTGEVEVRLTIPKGAIHRRLAAGRDCFLAATSSQIFEGGP